MLFISVLTLSKTLSMFEIKNVSQLEKGRALLGDPKTKFLRLFLSAFRPFVRPKKTSPDFAPVRRPTWGHCYKVKFVGPILYRCLHFRAKQTVYHWSQVGRRTGAKSGEVEGGKRRSEGGHWADNEGQWRTADGEKFLLRFSTAEHCFTGVNV